MSRFMGLMLIFKPLIDKFGLQSLELNTKSDATVCLTMLLIQNCKHWRHLKPKNPH